MKVAFLISILYNLPLFFGARGGGAEKVLMDERADASDV